MVQYDYSSVSGKDFWMFMQLYIPNSKSHTGIHPRLCPGDIPPSSQAGTSRRDLTSSLETKFRARSGQVHQIRGKVWEVLSPQDAKVGGSANFWVISVIQRAKFGVFVIYIFGGKIWGSNKNFRGKIWDQAPLTS